MRPPTSGTHTRRILYGSQGRAALIRGIDKMTALVAPTLGPTAGTVAIDSLVSQTPEILDSGATIARRTIQLADPFEDMGGMLVRHLLLTVFERVGDGTATTAVLTGALVHGLERYVASGGNVRHVERGLRCALEIALEITQFLRHGLGLRLTPASLASFFNQRPDLVFEQSLGPTSLPGFAFRMVFTQQGVEHSARVFQRMVKVHDLHAALEAIFAHVFQTGGAIDQHHHLAGAAQTPT